MTSSELFTTFALNFSIVHIFLFLFEAIYRSFVLSGKLLLILKYYFKYENFIKNKFLCKEV